MSEATADALLSFLKSDWTQYLVQMRYGGEFLAFLYYDNEEAAELISAIGGGDMEGSAMPYVFRSEAVLAGIANNPTDALRMLYERTAFVTSLSQELKREWNDIYTAWAREAVKVANCQLRGLSPMLINRVDRWKKKTTMVVAKVCDKEGCPLNRCDCSCHSPGVSMMHMFACCDPTTCPKCGEKKLTAADGGVYYKEKQ